MRLFESEAAGRMPLALFTRLFAVTRSALWERLDLLALLKSYGTASGRFKVIGALNDAWLPGFAPAKT